MANFGTLAFSPTVRYQFPGPMTPYPPRPSHHTARAFFASLKECQESNEIPTDRLLGSMSVVLKDKAKRWFRKNKYRWTKWVSLREAFENKYMKLLRFFCC
ncbi:hypothetical protein TKK_0010982 [Trichogramma kaykai]|uniref:Retrotransposon gag domain-containing protein n=1 Tax=Trichogramma kaykai TaxID=54128 RepID=A0ABD2WUP4_9HYME